jgi:hypothetical protein
MTIAPPADTPSMSARLGLTIGLTLAAVAFGGWRMALPGSDGASSDVANGVSAMLSTTLKAQFVGAQASLDAQRQATGSYAGALVQPPLTLVRADASSYCLQLEAGAVLQHLTGPGGAPQPGRC